MAAKTQTVKGKVVLADFLQLGANAFASGLMVAIALAVITLVLATSAQAAPIDGHPREGGNPSEARERLEEPGSAASTPAEEDTAGVGALWANLLLGTVALSSAGIAAFLGRAVPAGRL